MILFNLSEVDFDMVIWRYMTFPKFISLLSFKALWFSKLKYLNDGLEGTIPPITRQRMHNENQQWKAQFHEELHHQIDEFNDVNEENGRELIVVNCWFIGDNESEKMWKEYSSLKEGVAIKTTVKRLWESMSLQPKFSCIGRVEYVDHANFDMDSYKGSQGMERAFIKDKETFGSECELRVATLNIKTPCCVSPEGIQYTKEDVEDAKMNNPSEPGLSQQVILDHLFGAVVLSPEAPDYFYRLVSRLIELHGVKAKLSHSSLKSN